VADTYDNRLNRRATYRSETPEKALTFVREKCTEILDPQVVAALASVLGAGDAAGEMEIDMRPEDVCEGMVLTRPLRTMRGILLLPRNSIIRKEHLKRIRRQYGADPVVDRIYVYRREDAVPAAETAASK
jgi:hypothetical protein